MATSSHISVQSSSAIPCEPPPAYTPVAADSLHKGPSFAAGPSSSSLVYGTFNEPVPAQSALYPQPPHGAYVQICQPAPSVIVVGGCPACRVGVLEDDYGCCAILCAILFFPIGVLCCLALRERRCSNCGAVFG